MVLVDYICLDSQKCAEYFVGIKDRENKLLVIFLIINELICIGGVLLEDLKDSGNWHRNRIAVGERPLGVTKANDLLVVC